MVLGSVVKCVCVCWCYLCNGGRVWVGRKAVLVGCLNMVGELYQGQTSEGFGDIVGCFGRVFALGTVFVVGVGLCWNAVGMLP